MIWTAPGRLPRDTGSHFPFETPPRAQIVFRGHLQVIGIRREPGPSSGIVDRFGHSGLWWLGDGGSQLNDVQVTASNEIKSKAFRQTGLFQQGIFCVDHNPLLQRQWAKILLPTYAGIMSSRVYRSHNSAELQQCQSGPATHKRTCCVTFATRAL